MSGANYGSRSDLQQAPRAVPGQTYGQAGAQLASQQSVPLPSVGAGQGGAGGGGQATGQAPAPPSTPLTPINAPTQQPDTPLTAGLPSGPGAGPEALQGAQMSPIDEIRAMFQANPSDDMRRLVAYLDGY